MDPQRVKCPTCVVPGGKPCAGETSPRLCVLIETRKDYRVLALRLAGEPEPEHFRRAAACPHRECGVGCELTRCLAGKGDRDGGSHTTLLHCVECVRGS